MGGCLWGGPTVLLIQLPRAGLAGQCLPCLAALPHAHHRLPAPHPPCTQVRLTRLADGDILAVTLSHTITDGMRWPALLAHLASRYRQAARELNGLAVEVAADGLLVPSDRTAFSSAKLLETLPK